jgi:hypothetical protein
MVLQFVIAVKGLLKKSFGRHCVAEIPDLAVQQPFGAYTEGRLKTFGRLLW